MIRKENNMNLSFILQTTAVYFWPKYISNFRTYVEVIQTQYNIIVHHCIDST